MTDSIICGIDDADSAAKAADSDGETAAVGFDAAWLHPANGDETTHDAAARDFAGGIVRFGVGR